MIMRKNEKYLVQWFVLFDVIHSFDPAIYTGFTGDGEKGNVPAVYSCMKK
jgi:hypothetical protein